MLETYCGYIKTPQDALIIFEACRLGHLSRVQRRLSTKERVHIKSGSIFVWDENEAGMRRWTDGKTWSPSRVLGSFLTYRELDTKRRPRRVHKPSSSHPLRHHHAHQFASASSSALCSYKPDGLIKQSFSICTATRQKLHLISYYSKRDLLSGRLKQPGMDTLLGNIAIPKGLYPDVISMDGATHPATLHQLRQMQEHHHHHHHAHDAIVIDAHSSSNSSSSSSSSSSYLSANSSPLHESSSRLSSSSPPSLSSSPCSSDEDLTMDFSSDAPAFALSLPTQDIAWEKIPCSEDRRQLQALQGQLRL